MVYADFNYYKDNYKGQLPENTFNYLIIRASREIDKNINTRLTENKINNLSEEAQDLLKYTACALTDLINRKADSEGKKVNSISIDGVSKNFNTLSNEEYISSKKEVLGSLPDELTCYL